MESKAGQKRFEDLVQSVRQITKGPYAEADTDYFPLRFVFRDILKTYKIPSDGYDAEFVAALMANGFLPFSDGVNLVPKLHYDRCIVNLQQSSIEDYFDRPKPGSHPSSIKRHSLEQCVKRVLRRMRDEPDKKFLLRFNKGQKEILAFTQSHHWSFWLSKDLQNTLTKLSGSEWVASHKQIHAAFCELCLYDTPTGHRQILSTDIGYRAGSVYTSMSGSCEKSFPSIGTLHLVLLKEYLIRNKFKCWDFGMYMSYKMDFGAIMAKRKAFVSIVNFCQTQPCDFPDSDIDLSAFEPFLQLVGLLKKRREAQEERRRQLKSARRLPKELKLIEKSTHPQDWSPEYLAQWAKIKAGADVGSMTLADLKGLSKPAGSLSKRKLKKLKKLLVKLSSNDKLKAEK